MYYRVEADIDLDAIRENIITMKNCIPKDKKLLAVIKANGYGHGAVELAEELDDLAHYYGVACIDEAIELRKANITKPILILGVTDSSLFQYIVQYDITQTIFSYEQAKLLSETAQQLGKIAKLHIKLDTGMNRIGFFCDDKSVEEIEQIVKLDNLDVEGVFTHYYKADCMNKDLALKQFELFTTMIDKLEKKGITFKLRHISNSAGIMEMPNDQYDMVRSGISTYGLYPSEEMDKASCILYPAMSFKSHITHIKKVGKGQTIGYGASYTLPCDKVIATVGVGYADGYQRGLSNEGRMLVRGKYAPIVGRVCMDQTMIDISDIPEVSIGDEVVLFGRQGDNQITVEEVADMCKSFNYEFVCDINRRVPRVYYKNKKVVSVHNYLLEEFSE